MSLEPCPNCNKKISTDAETCPKCGHPITPQLWKEAKDKNIKDTAQSNRHVTYGCLITIAVILAIYLVFKVLVSSNEEDRAEKECTKSVSAYFYSRQFVEKILKSPSTAKFGSLTNAKVMAGHLGACRHQVIGYVDAQNSFGATTRTFYTIVMEYNKANDTWYKLTASMDVADSYSEINNKANSIYSLFVKPKSPAKVSGSNGHAKNKLVRRIQKSLSETGYYRGEVDGLYGPQTKRAIERYEQDRGLKVTGKATQKLFEDINAQAVDTGQFSREQICKAGIAIVMGRDPAIINTDRVQNDVIYISYRRANDGTHWAYKCKLVGNRIIWER